MQDDPGLRGVRVPFDDIGERYDDELADRTAQLAAGQWVLEHTTVGDKVLDLGCGTGHPTAAQLSAAGREVTGVDNSARMLAIGRARLPDVRFVHRDVRSLAAGHGEFHAVVAFFSLLMLPRTDIEAVLADVAGLLVPGGPFVLAMVEADLDGVTGPLLGTEATFSAYPRAELVSTVQRAGFLVDGVDEAAVEFNGQRETQLFVRAWAR